MKSPTLYTLAGGFTLGILLSSFFKMGFSFFLLILLLSSCIYVFGKFFAENKRAITLLAIFILSFGLGILRYEIKEIRGEENNLSAQLEERVTVTGVIIDEPVVKDETVRLTVTGHLLVSTGLFPELHYGDLIEVKGKLERPENFETDNGREFDYAGYLAKDDIYYRISFAEVKVISAGHGSFVRTKLFAFKNAFLNKLNFLIKEPESALLGGLILGAKNSLGQEWQDDFRLAGVSHIVALSGYNITIVAVGIMFLLSFLPRIWAMSFGAVGIFLFAIMTGGSATVLRASIMALLVLLAKSTGRKYDISRALLLAGVFMLIQNPKILVFDLSFQLSFLATLALILISPLIENKVTFITERYHLREVVTATIATQIFVLPFILYKMGTLSIFALPANFLILPLLPTIMLFGFITGLLGFISVTLAWPVAFFTSLLLSYMLKVIYFFSHLPLSAVSLNNFPLSLTILIYLAFLVIIWRIEVKKKRYEAKF
jgi:competence protein ComEC